MKKRKTSFPIKKALSAFFGLMLACNLAAGIRLGASVATDSIVEANSSIILEQALAYLENSIGSEGFVGNSATVNDTADAVRIFRQDGEHDLSSQLAWLGKNLKTDNTDIAARVVSASGNPAYLADVLKIQNADGGFGLNAGYRSDVPDTQLVLAAVNDCGGGELTEAGKKAAHYLAAQAAPDGSYAYTETSAADDVLTATVLYDLSRFAAIEQDENSPVIKANEQTAVYVRKHPADSYADDEIETAVTQQLALLTYDGKIDSAGVVGKLKQVQKPDGSFAESVHVTALAIQLIRAVNAGKYMNLTAFRTDLSSDTVTSGESDTITAKTSIGYQSNCTGDYTVSMTVKNGTAVVYENSTKVTIPEGEGSLAVETGAFRLIESEDHGVTVTVDLLNGEKLIRSEVISITLKKHNPEKKTAISAFTVDLDNYYTLAGFPMTVRANGTILYSTNVDQEAEVYAVIRKNGEVVAETTGSAVLSTEDNSAEVPLFEVSMNTDEPGDYEFSADCIYEDKILFSDSKTFTVVAFPEENEPQQTEPVQTEPVVTEPHDPDVTTVETEQTAVTTFTTVTETVPETTTAPAPHFDVMWMNPLLSDMVVYAGQMNDISGKVDIIYDSDYPFIGKLSVKAVSGEETIAENETDVTLEPVNLRTHEQNLSVPKYESENLISFVADKVGKITVTAVLTDTEGNEIKRASRTVSVIEKPVQDLILYADTDEENASVDLRWNDVSNEHESYVYQLNRRIQGGQWEPRSIWNEEEHIRILNVYPAYPYLEQWMNSPLGDTGLTAGMDIFEIDSMHFNEFNPKPEEVLKNKDGSWKYDVLFFGSYDCNGYCDLSNAAYEVVQAFVDEGRGVLFGHDTICPNFNLVNFTRFADQLGIIAKLDSRVVSTSSVSVVKIGTMTNYPWVIRGTLEVPPCHSYGQYVGGTLKGTEWMTLNATQYYDEETGAHSNFYLVTNNNLGMIQTGHSNGQATDDERKVLANTLFYLYQISRLTTAKDTSFYDIAAPDKPDSAVRPLENGSYEITAKSMDNGTTYEYVIVASPASGENKTLSSNTITKEVKSGLAGFVAYFSDSDKPAPELVQFDETGDHVLNLQPADASGKAVLTVEPESYDDGRYIHVFAIDKANNISEESIVEAAILKLNAEVRTDRKQYMPGETVSVGSDTTVAPFGLVANGMLRIVDEFDHPTAVLREMPEQRLTASTAVNTEAEWKIPDTTFGRYKAVITWEKDGEVLAESETLFKVSGEQGVADTIASDKKTYSSGEPVNLSTKVFNNSSNLVENDLTLQILVRSKENGTDAAVFSREIASVNPQGSLEFADAIRGGTLQPGSYVAVASVMQDGAALVENSTNFTVVSNVNDFSGTLGLKLTDKTVNAAFAVTNTGSADASGAEITVEVFSADGTQVFTVTKQADIAADGTVQFDEPFSAADLEAGNYSGVLSVRYDGKRSDLAYAGFTIDPVVTTTVITTTADTTVTTVTEAAQTTTTVITTAAETTVTAVTENAQTTTTTIPREGANSPSDVIAAMKMGVKGIPWYIWTMLGVSCIGLLTLKKAGGRKEHE